MRTHHRLAGAVEILFSVDPVMVVFANERTHEHVAEFLETLQTAFEKHAAGK